MSPRDVLITGIGLVSSLGEGNDAHWRALSVTPFEPVIDSARFAPFTVHPLPPIDWSLQIPKRGDQRQMETWQRLGTYGAGLALEDSGLKEREDLCGAMDMIVAAGGGERDEAVDNAILDASRERSDRDVLLNEKLTVDLRPTLFLAQLSNLLAGNISIVHKVTGSSRTFMGEEGAGVSAIETAAARIRSGQSSHVLVGAAYNAEHPDMLLSYETGGWLHRGPWKPVWQRHGGAGGGVVTGSGAAFLVLESREHADARGRAAYAELGPVASSRARRDRGELPAALTDMAVRVAPPEREFLVFSAASGAHEATQAEKAFLDGLPGAAVRSVTSATGHLKEAQFPFAVAIAALAMSKGEATTPLDRQAEAEFDGKPTAALAVCVGFNRFEGMALVAPAD
ncbi:MAG TPA: beta-ketoacyl-ACP synthase [Mesorhizobium sp.]|jgi:3-oxoacyl-[acyl-carrier-protein] synthase II|nr:beta-ketoacyl-ACP synthase [Mesorhizobium sp.]